ncbi:MAG: hypothetical protein JST46_18115 [Bacteroidetes bacterium]|nr:hypothetical protein [Bacteroidota bacterium]
MIKCVSNKVGYPSASIAEEALLETHIRYDFGKTTGPVNIYRCEECGQYHLTSSGLMNERLASFIKEGELDKHRKAMQWVNKLKRL